MIKKLLKNKALKGVIIAVLCLCLLGGVAVVGINAYMISYANKYILTEEDLKSEDFDCIMVLGAGLWDGEPSPMLQERLDFGLIAYETECSEKLLMSGDHGRKEYDEVNKMKELAVQNGVPADNVFMDHAGFSTYESMYRARDVFDVDSMIIVTQKYHLYRALHISSQYNIEAYGVASNQRRYVHQIYYSLREVLARNKDYAKYLFV